LVISLVSLAYLTTQRSDTSDSFQKGRSLFLSRHPSPVEPTSADIQFLRTLSSYISRRSASIVAASVVALWELKTEAEAEFLGGLSTDSSFILETEAEMKLTRTMVAFNGSVIEHYPGYQETLKGYIDALIASSELSTASIDFVPAKESSLLGAAVALACLEEKTTILLN